MNAENLPYIVLLVGPGFIAMQVRSWASEDYRLSDIQRLIWSALASALLFFAYHGFLRHFPWKFGSIASPEDLLSQPSSVPFQFLIALYAVAAIGGWLVGRTFDNRTTGQVLRGVGLDPAKHRDVWRAAFRESRNVTVFLSKGDIYRGWAGENSTGLNVEDRFLILQSLRYWDKGEKDWVDPEARFLMIRVDEVSHIEFRDRPPALPSVSRFPSSMARILDRFKRRR